jgi:serine O-acetyltransferase
MNAIHLYRVGRWLFLRRVPLLPKAVYWLTFLIYNSSIPPSAEIGVGSRFGYGGMGVVIHRRAILGSRVLIAQQVTIGGRSGHWDVPIIEDDVYLAAGSRILGPVRIGKGAIVGANAVVIHDVPAGAVVGGIPAKPLKRRAERDALAALGESRV